MTRSTNDPSHKGEAEDGDKSVAFTSDLWMEEGLDPELLGAFMESLSPVIPGDHVRKGVMERVGDREPSNVRPSVRQTESGPDTEASGGRADDAQPKAGGSVVKLSRRHRRSAIGVLWRVAAAVVLVSVGIGVGHWTAMDSMAPTEHYAHLNQAQDVQRVSDTMPDGHVATLTWSQDMSMTALTLPEEMMEASAEKSLQVWLLKGGATTSLGIYNPSAGTGFTFLDLMPENGERVFVTLEPEGGSERPTGEAVVVFDIGTDGTATRRDVRNADEGQSGTADV
ncbi:anti-sigma factor [Actinomyces sp.]|uniref:anti-sigma factor n=1 Tax=Actinomyces sp. TaxID=29317 RepID=UPI0026DD2C9F|nr:anti-sigma factor [Actinomyces sp.]MDO4901288.1 anti-sigma factor [Actinomyces sp.]